MFTIPGLLHDIGEYFINPNIGKIQHILCFLFLTLRKIYTLYFILPILFFKCSCLYLNATIHLTVVFKGLCGTVPDLY